MATASNSFNSPFQASFQRVAETAATYGFALVDEVHSLVDEPTYVPKQIHPRVKQLAVTGLIFFGTLISTLGKLAYEVEAVGRDGTTRPFGKPWFLVLLMFAGMSLNLPLSLFLDLARSLRRRSKYLARLIARSSSTRRRLTYEPYQPLYTPLLQFDADDDEVYQAPRVLQSPFASSSTTAAATLRFRLLDKQLLLLAVPTLFDLAGAALLNVGLLAVTASATQMLRQSLLPFAALMGVCLWGKRMNRYHLTGLAGCMTGLCMVAAAALASGFGGSSAPSSRGAMAAGIGLILASQMLAAGQLLIDQGWYYSRLQLSPLKVVGAEGLLGFVLTLCVVLPLAQVSAAPEGWGLAEDSWDSLVMVGSRPLLQLLLLAYTGSLAAYNICGMVTTGELSAVDTALLQALVDVASQLPGEPWLGWSFLQAAGFLILVLAAVTYSKGDNERQRRQLQDEAALIMMDRPPSVAGSFASGAHAAAGRRFTAHMDIDAAAYLRSLARGSFRDQREREMVYRFQDSPGQGSTLNASHHLEALLSHLLHQQSKDYKQLCGSRGMNKSLACGCLQHSTTACFYFLPPHGPSKYDLVVMSHMSEHVALLPVVSLPSNASEEQAQQLQATVRQLLEEPGTHVKSLQPIKTYKLAEGATGSSQKLPLLLRTPAPDAPQSSVFEALMPLLSSDEVYGLLDDAWARYSSFCRFARW
ncbi:hypothetical protein OEZ86_013840 [Tetradesmus obliquus]|nr:hypothetical protein OEZ86_013840 [Tetradesmus obliquus]